MKSLAISLAFSTPNIKIDYHKTSRSNIPQKNYEAAPTTLLPQPNLVAGRREVVSSGACISIGIIANILLQSHQAFAYSCELTTSPSGLAFCDQIVGTGPQALKGQLIKAHYVGKLENGKVFDSSYNRGKPLTFRVGIGEVIKGWDQGIIGSEGVPPMLAGGKRTLMIPPELGYGIRGAGCKGGTCIIPPNSVLYFEVEFVGKV